MLELPILIYKASTLGRLLDVTFRQPVNFTYLLIGLVHARSSSAIVIDMKGGLIGTREKNSSELRHNRVRLGSSNRWSFAVR